MRFSAALACLSALLLPALPEAARGAPIDTLEFTEKWVKARTARATTSESEVLKKPLEARLLSSGIRWDYIPGTSVSVPYVMIELRNVPNEKGMSVLIARAAKLPRSASGVYKLVIPIVGRISATRISVVDVRGGVEDWDIEIELTPSVSAIFVDETCKEYAFKIKELRRSLGPTVMFVGCRPGARPQELSLDLLWGDAMKVMFGTSAMVPAGSVITLPVDSKKDSETDLIGIGKTRQQNAYRISYTPIVPQPFEFWAGLAFFQTTFEQSNFKSRFKQVGSAFLGQFWYRPQDIRLSIMLRGFGNLYAFSETLEPDLGYDESVQTYFTNAEMRYRVLDMKGWRLDPFIGGWMFFMRVKSRNFGVQRALSPMFGLFVQKEIDPRRHLNLTLRGAPLQSGVSPGFSLDQSYLELELTYVHSFKSRNRLFGTLYAGSLNFTDEGLAQTSGSYLVLGGGYGW